MVGPNRLVGLGQVSAEGQRGIFCAFSPPDRKLLASSCHRCARQRLLLHTVGGCRDAARGRQVPFLWHPKESKDLRVLPEPGMCRTRADESEIGS